MFEQMKSSTQLRRTLLRVNDAGSSSPAESARWIGSSCIGRSDFGSFGGCAFTTLSVTVLGFAFMYWERNLLLVLLLLCRHYTCVRR